MSRPFKQAKLIASLLALVVATKLAADEPPANKSDAKASKKAKVAVSVSKETTYITEPLRKDGSVNYIAALNERSRQGVTLENNSAVLFWQAVGPGEIWEDVRDKYFQMLGIPRLPEKGNYFVSRQCREIFGIPEDTETFFDSFNACIPLEERDAFQASISYAVSLQKRW